MIGGHYTDRFVITSFYFIVSDNGWDEIQDPFNTMLVCWLAVQ